MANYAQRVVTGVTIHVYTGSLTSSSPENVHVLLSSVKMLTPMAESVSKSWLVSAG